MRAKGANVSQLYYAKQGLITPEMEYIAIWKTNVLIITRTNQSHAMPTPRK
jgi:phosphomethylpyrimidine synthase